MSPTSTIDTQSFSSHSSDCMFSPRSDFLSFPLQRFGDIVSFPLHFFLFFISLRFLPNVFGVDFPPTSEEPCILKMPYAFYVYRVFIISHISLYPLLIHAPFLFTQLIRANKFPSISIRLKFLLTLNTQPTNTANTTRTSTLFFAFSKHLLHRLSLHALPPYTYSITSSSNGGASSSTPINTSISAPTKIPCIPNNASSFLCSSSFSLACL